MTRNGGNSRYRLEILAKLLINVRIGLENFFGFFGSMNGDADAVETDGNGFEEMSQFVPDAIETGEFAVCVVAVLHGQMWRLRMLMMWRMRSWDMSKRAARLSYLRMVGMGNVS